MNSLLRNIVAIIIVIMVLPCCHKSNFFEDPNHSGLSRFTNRGYDVASAYINNQPWVSGFSAYNGPAPPAIYLDTTSTQQDTLYIQWQGDYSSNPVYPSFYWSYVTMSIPVKKNFTLNDFLSWNNKIFDSTTVTISLDDRPVGPGWSSSGFVGKGKIYFIRIEPRPVPGVDFRFSGLFEGKIDATFVISEGRFDYDVSRGFHNLP